MHGKAESKGKRPRGGGGIPTMFKRGLVLLPGVAAQTQYDLVRNKLFVPLFRVMLCLDLLIHVLCF
jgi:hypothetical protein